MRLVTLLRNWLMIMLFPLWSPFALLLYTFKSGDVSLNGRTKTESLMRWVLVITSVVWIPFVLAWEIIFDLDVLLGRVDLLDRILG